MPWTRPVLKKWNSTMFQVINVMRNHSWQNYTRYYFPRLVNYTVIPIQNDIYVMTWFLTNFPSNTSVTEHTMKSSFGCPMAMRMNYTQWFHNFTECYTKLTAKTLNFTQNITELFLNRLLDLSLTLRYLQMLKKKKGSSKHKKVLVSRFDVSGFHKNDYQQVQTVA